MKDFTLHTYKKLLMALQKQGFSFLSFEEFMISATGRSVILRHDVDLLPENALEMARIEASLKIKASYHFRIVRESNDPLCIKKIVDLGHEIGYHYEDLNFVADVSKTDGKESINLNYESDLFKSVRSRFDENLEYFRQYYPVKVISMHGSPRSRYDNRDIWKYLSYKDFGIICEPYFDVDYSKVLYLTDTGRSWAGEKFNLRDKIIPGFGSTSGKPLIAKFNLDSTSSIINASLNNLLPDQIIINTHPQRWTNKLFPWIKELVWQNLKNIIKYFLIRKRN